jgi:hypothetical protein
MEHTRDSFRRGLISLPDHLDHLAAFYETQARSVAFQMDQEARSQAGYEANRPPRYDRRVLEKAYQPVFQARLAALGEAVRMLEEFNEPASKGWAADLALSRVALRQAQLDMARLTGSKGAMVALSREQQELAAEHYWLRLQDADLGLASLPDLVQAVSLLNVAPEFRRNLLKGASEQTVIWESVGAEIGRPDAATRARLDLSWLDGYRDNRKGEIQVNDAAWRQSDELAQSLFQQREAYYSKGTATIGDLSRTWELRQQMFRIAAEARYEIPAASRQQHRRNLESLTQLASAITDLRGRHAADVTFVRLLGNLSTAERIP